MNQPVYVSIDRLLPHTDLTPAEVHRKVAKAVARWVFKPTVRYVTQEEMAQFHPPDRDTSFLPHHMAEWSKLVHIAVDPSKHEGVPLDAEEVVVTEVVDEDVVETMIYETLFGRYPTNWPKI